MNHFVYWDGEKTVVVNTDDDLMRNNPVRTKAEYPYSYDPFTTWGGPSEDCNGSVYTDRLRDWDYDKTQRIGDEVFGRSGNWFGRGLNPKKVELFLQRWMDEPALRLTRVVEYCNVSTGYPVWRLDYHTPEKKNG
jgi:hypothetical protein